MVSNGAIVSSDLGMNVGINLGATGTLLVDGGTVSPGNLTIALAAPGRHDHETAALSMAAVPIGVGVNVGSTVTISRAEDPRSLVVSAA